MQYDVTHACDILSRTPNILRAWLWDLGDEWTRSRYGADTFSPFDVVGHLVEGELNDWLTRARIILAHGTERPFDPYDRYAMYERDQGRTMNELLQWFEEKRTANLDELRSWNLTAEQLVLPGIHPALGEVTLAQLLSSWVVHDLGHLHQIAKCMAHQYRHNVGPWHAYLTILPRDLTE